MTTISATSARANFFDLLDEVSNSGKRVGITNKGETKAILISQEELNGMIATIETLSDRELMNQIRESEKDIKAGRVRDWEEIKKELHQGDVSSKVIKSSRKRT